MKHWLTLIILATLALPAHGQFAQSINQILAQDECKNAAFSIQFCDASNGELIYQHNAGTALAPASNMKIITTAAAFEQLQVDFVYETTFGMLGQDLAVFGSGDPLLGDPVYAQQKNQTIYAVFDELLNALTENDITIINGDLLIDDTIFDDNRFHSSWPVEQSNNWYTAQVSAVCFNDNCIDVTLTPNSQAGRPANYTLTPNTDYAQITNRTETISSGSNTGWASRQLSTNDLTLRGNVRTEQTINVTVDRPSAYFGYVLAEYLLCNDIAIEGRLIIRRLRQDNGQLPPELQILTTHTTPLADVIKRCNTQSLNLAAECVFKTLGIYHQLPNAAAIGQGSWETGRLAVRDFLNQLNVNQEAIVIDDGSGLSRENRLTARAVTTVLTHCYQSPEIAPVFRDSLATPNNNSTLSKRARFSTPELCDRIQAKTGYIAGAWALSGYCQDLYGRWMAFSILANRSRGGSLRPIIDEIVIAAMQH